MANVGVEKSFTLTLKLNEDEVNVLSRALHLVRDFGDLDDWDTADHIRFEIDQAVNG